MDTLFLYFVLAAVLIIGIAWAAVNFNFILNSILLIKNKFAKKGEAKQEVAINVNDNRSLITNTSFEQIISGSELMQTMSESVLTDVNKAMDASSLGLADSLIKGVEYIQESNEYIVKFSKEGQKLLKSDAAKLVQKKSGEFIPQLTKGGKFVEHAELTKNGRKVLKNLSKVSTLAVCAAHMISGADMSKKIEKLLEKADFIIADRENERMAELEAIYKTIKEMLIENNGQLTSEQVREYTHKLYKLRSNWRKNAEYKLGKIRKPEEKYWLKHRISRRSVDKEVYSEISACMKDLHKVRSSLFIHLAICYETGSLQDFQANMMEAEIRADEEVLKILQSKGRYISGRYKKEGITSVEALEFLETHIQEQKTFRMDYNTATLKEIEA